jgi:hypothetical protein
MPKKRRKNKKRKIENTIATDTVVHSGNDHIYMVI